jgi:hypothetical protein
MAPSFNGLTFTLLGWVGTTGDGGEYEHTLLWMMVKDNGKKHMCQACGQFFVLQRDPSGAAAPIH